MSKPARKTRWAYRPLPAAIAGAAVLLAVLLTRTLGVHGDENAYLGWARGAPLGDALSMGKVYGFYALNYALYHTLGAAMGSLAPLSPFAAYIVLAAAALAWLVARLAPEPSRPACFALILLAPFTLFNATQLMQETPMLILEAVLLGVLLDPRLAPSRRGRLAILLCGAALVAIKDDGVVPLLTLAAVFAPRSRRSAAWLAASALAGFALNRAMLGLVHAPDFYAKTVTVSFDGWSHFLERGRLLGEYVWVWGFFLWPPLLGAAFYAARGRLDGERRLFLHLIFASLAATLLVDFASAVTFARYCYPLLWLGLIACAALASRLRPAAAAAIALTYAVPAAALWGNSPNRMRLWPATVADEAYASGFTVLPGTPVWGWVAVSGRQRRNLCVLMPRARSENDWGLRNFIEAVSTNPRFFDESSVAEFLRCAGPKAVLARQYRDDPSDCSPACSASLFRVRNCVEQPMKIFAARPGVVTNVTCLP